MISRLIEALRELDPPLSSRELADALWLAELMPAGEETAETAPPPPPPPGRVPEPPANVQAPAVPAQNEPMARAPVSVPQAGLYLAGQEAASRPFAIRSPTVPALPGTLRLSRALRPLRVPVPSPTRREMDENSTARRAAETGVWDPVMRPSIERWLDLALVVDTAASMVVWGHTTMELRTLLQRLGAFRDVRTWQMDSDRHPLLLNDVHPPDELIDTTRRRVILVVSDCIGSAWQDGSAAALLERWGRAGPVAIVQPLPQRLWWRGGAAVEPVVFGAPVRGVSNDRLAVRTGEAGAPLPPGVPIPVMEPAPRWLGPWASMIANGGEVSGAALFTGRPVAAVPPEAEHDEERTPAERVMLFRAASSPTAFALAGYLAAAPLKLKVMRLVQQAMLPGSSPTHLAEVFLGGLLRTAGTGTDPDDLTYEFHDGVRDVLLGSLNRGEALRVLREVWEVVRDRFGSTLDFPALLGAIERNEGELPFDKPFAQVAVPVLARLGGRYTELADRLTSTVEASPGTELQVPPSRTTLPIWDGVPPRNPYFTGRHFLLDTIHEARHTSVTVLIQEFGTGGGEGKTQLATEYAHRFADFYDVICWIPAEQPESAGTALARLARKLGTPLGEGVRGTVHNLLRELREGDRNLRWLLIYDNASKPDELLPLLPVADEGERRLRPSHPSGHILVTSRKRAWHDRAAIVGVPNWNRPETVDFLRRRVPRLRTDEADRIAERVRDLPLAVELAAAWLTGTGGSPGEYLRLLDRRSLSDRATHSRLLTVPATALRLNLDRLRAERPAAARLFELWVFFGPEPVTARLLSAGRDAELPAELAEVLADETRLSEEMAAIARLALGHFKPTAVTLQASPLVREVLLAGMNAADRAQVRDHVHRILSEATPRVQMDETTWPLRAEITPHVVPSRIVDGGPETRHVAKNQAQFLYYQGDFEGSRRLAALALDRWRERYGTDDPLTVEVARVLANALRGLGDLPNAARLSAAILKRSRERLGGDHLGTLFAANGFGADLRLGGDFAGAYALDQDTWARIRHYYGGDNGDTLMVANSISIDLRLLGRFPEAYEVDSESLRWLRNQEAPHDSQHFRVINNLARDLHALGRYQEAMRLQEESLRPGTSAMGQWVLHARMSYAGALREWGALASAVQVAAETHEESLRIYGAEHPNTLSAKVMLAMARTSAGALRQVPSQLREALASFRLVLGDDHPFAHAGAAGLGIALRATGNPRAALEIDEAALAALHDGPLGPDHYYSLSCAVGLANDFHLLGAHDAARELSFSTLEGFRRTHGPAHPHTLACAHNHEIFKRSMDRPTDGSSATALSKLLGDRHYKVRAAMRGELLECPIELTPL